MSRDVPPTCWAAEPLGELFDVLDHARVPINASERSRRVGSVPYYGATGQVGWIDDWLFDEELILLGEDGAPFLQARPKAYLVRGRSWVNNHAHVLRASGGTPSGFWKYQLDQVDYAPFVTGTTRLKLSQGPMRRIPLLVPPVQEQHRIVAALDSYFTRLDDAMATLERVQANLKRYRASVLKAAVEGRLVPTEAELARKEGREYEPASVLLERILVERRCKWEEAELAKMVAKGKPPTNDKWKSKYKEPTPPDTEGLPELPEGWCWATVDALGEVQGGISKGKRRSPGVELRDVAYLRVANVQRGYLDLSVVKTILVTDEELEQLKLEVGDVLFNEGGDRDKLGRGWIWSGEVRPCVHQNHVFRVRPNQAGVEPRYLSWYGNSGAQKYFLEQGKQTTNLASINKTKLSALPIPLPPRSEQSRIVARAAELLTTCDHATGDVSRNQSRASRLRQSILKWAFEGRLVDQDPDDEPASVLLERIRAERDAAAAKPKAKRVTRKRKAKS